MFDMERWKNRNIPNAILIDPLTEKTYNVVRRQETTYRSGRFHFLNVNRLPLELGAILEKGYPLIVSYEVDKTKIVMEDFKEENRTYLLVVERTYSPAAKWQNMTAKILNTPLQFVEALTEWQRSHPPTQASFTT